MPAQPFPHELVRPDRILLNQDSLVRLQMLEMWSKLQEASFDSALLKKLILRYADSEKQIRSLYQQLSEDLKAAAEIQRTLLPVGMLETETYEAVWKFQPCEAVGGDLVGLRKLDDNRLACFVLDVAGHGPRAAMITVSVAQFLKQAAGIDLFSPNAVMDALEKEFPFTRFGSFFTIIYGVFDLQQKIFTFCNAGHPCPLLAKPEKEAEMIAAHDPMLGLGFDSPRNEITLDLAGGGSLLLYSDGLTECVAPDGSFFGEERLLASFAACRQFSATEIADTLFTDSRNFTAGVSFKDDFTLLVLRGK